MSGTWVEQNDSRSAKIVRKGRRDQSTIQKKWKVFGITDDIALHNECNSRFSAGSLYQIGDYVLLMENYDVKHLGGGVWEVTASFKRNGENADTPAPMKRSRSFDTTGGKQKITQQIYGTEARFPSTAPSMGNAINYNGQSVQGVDVIIPSLVWQEQYEVPSIAISATYIRSVSSLTGTVNDNVFRVFPEGEVLFSGGSGSQQLDSDAGYGSWQLTYKFVASSNAGVGSVLPPIMMGLPGEGVTGGVEKKGHEFLWVLYEDGTDETDTTSKEIVPRPSYAYVNKVYRESDFNSLGIGVGTT